MAVARKITVELSAQAVEEIDAKVAAGVYEDTAAFVLESVENNLARQEHTRYDGSANRWFRPTNAGNARRPPASPQRKSLAG